MKNLALFVRRVGVSIAVFLTLFIFVCIPFRFIKGGVHQWKIYMSPKENPDVIQRLAGAYGFADVVKEERIFYLDGEPIYGQKDNNGYSVAVVDYDEAMSFKARSKYFKYDETIEAHDPDKKLVLVHILLANDSDDDDMTNSAGQFYLERKGRSYPYEPFALQTLQDCNMYEKKKILPGETIMVVLPFGVNQDENVDDLNLVYFPSIFTPTVSLPLAGKRL